MSKVFGVDISYWQRGISIKKLKQSGVKFALIRAMYGNSKDLCFEDFYSLLKEEQIPVGCYLYGLAKNVAQAREEAQALINYCLKGKQFEYPIYYDVEDKILLNLGINETTEIVKAFCETLENAGYFVGVYMNESTYNREVNSSELSRLYSQWRAKWTREENRPLNVDMWQFGGETNLINSTVIAGYVCDQDYSYIDFEKIIKEKGLNGFSNQLFGSPRKNNDELVNEVIDGKWGNGIDRKISLTNAGYDYDKIQKMVNDKLKDNNEIVYYKIKYGDTLSGIALNFNTTVNKLVSWNNIKNPNLIYAGKVIRVK